MTEPPGRTTRPSAVGALLRAAGLQPGSRRSDVDTVGIRDAERKTGVSRQTLSMYLKPVGPQGRRYDPWTLDRVAHGLGVDRRALGIAAMRDNGVMLAGTGDDMADLYEYLGNRDESEQVQILAWLAQRVALRDTKGDAG